MSSFLKFCVIFTLLVFGSAALYSLYLLLGGMWFTIVICGFGWFLAICGGQTIHHVDTQVRPLDIELPNRVYKHAYDSNCPCWTCARELNPDFIDDPANGQYKYWKDVPEDPVMSVLLKVPVLNHLLRSGK